MFGTPRAAVGTTSHELHRLRRGALNPFFSKRSVTQLEPAIRANVELLLSRLQDFAGSQQPINLMDAFTCLSADIIGSYAFGQSYEFLHSPDFCPGWHKLMVVRDTGNPQKDSRIHLADHAHLLTGSEP